MHITMARTCNDQVRPYSITLTFVTVCVLAACALAACAPNTPATQDSAAAPTATTPAFTADGWLDVTAPLDSATTPVYEGDAPLKFEFLLNMKKGDKLTLSKYTMGAHSGTHVDAPMHFVADGVPVDRVPLSALIGTARVVDIPDSVQSIDAAELNKHDWKGAERVLFRTRSSVRGWMSSPTFHRDFAYVAPDAAQLLADAGVKLVGIDYISIEQFGFAIPQTHQILLGKGIPVVEGLSLVDIKPGDYDLVVLPIRVVGHDGAPARAILRRHEQ